MGESIINETVTTSIVFQILDELKHKVVERLHPKWEELGRELHMSDESLQEIGRKHNNDLKRCLAVLMKWKQTSYGTHSWRILIGAINNMGENDFARYLRDQWQYQSQRPDIIR